MQRLNRDEGAIGRWIVPHQDALERLAESADALHAFLRPSWYSAANNSTIFQGFESNGRLIAAFPMITRKMGPFPVREVAGAYWPFRSLPLAQDAEDDEIRAMMASSGAREALGKAWRLGPVQDNDPSLVRLLRVVQDAGWVVFKRSISHSFDIDVAAMRDKGVWPSKSATRQCRNYANRLARMGEVEYRHAKGTEWTEDDRDAMAAIEANSWLTTLDNGADTKFLDPARRKMWEEIATDPALAPFLFCSIMRVGGTPIAFTFGLEVGSIRYQIANNFHEDYKDCSPGRIILTMDFADAAERGVPTINWGAGDAGYKARYGAEPGPEIIDLLFLDKNWLVPFATPILSRKGWQRS